MYSNIVKMPEGKLVKTHNNSTQTMKFSIKDFFSKCDQIRRNLVTLTEEIVNGKLHFL